MGEKGKGKKDVVLEMPVVEETKVETAAPITAVVVAGGRDLANAIVPDLFGDIDFEGLNNAIDAMGDASKELGKKEKQMAIDIIAEWNNNVVNRLRNKSYDMDSFIRFFDVNDARTNINHMVLEDFGDELAEKTGTVAELQAVKDAEAAHRDHASDKPIRPVREESQTYEEFVRLEKEYEADAAIHQTKLTRLHREKANAIGKWKRKMSQTTEVQDLLKEARKFTRGVGNMQKQATDKAQLAKLNITISSKAARDSLKSLLNFSTTI